MFKKRTIYRFLFLLVCVISVSCTHRTYDNTGNPVPIGINYSYYNSGPGTSLTAGAIVINIISTSANNYNEYYLVQIYGVGSYVIQPGYAQLFIPNVWANSYTFSVEKVCTAGTNSTCTARTLTGFATINVETTTVVDVWL